MNTTKNIMEDHKNCVIIDGGYYMFYRFYATKLWFKKACTDEYETLDQNDMQSTATFIEMFNKKIISNIMDISKRFRCPVHKIIVASDSPRSSLWRTKLELIDYKAGRKKVPGIGKIISQGYNSLSEMKNSPIIMSCPEAEADDIIAILSKKIVADSNHDVIIISNDRDMDQLQCDRIHIHTLAKGFPPPKFIDPRTSLLMKIIGGDKSDNIPPIAPRMGKKTIMDFIMNPDILQAFLSKNKSAEKQYNDNRMMIDFNEIPDNLKNQILERCKSLPFF